MNTRFVKLVELCSILAIVSTIMLPAVLANSNRSASLIHFISSDNQTQVDYVNRLILTISPSFIRNNELNEMFLSVTDFNYTNIELNAISIANELSELKISRVDAGVYKISFYIYSYNSSSVDLNLTIVENFTAINEHFVLEISKRTFNDKVKDTTRTLVNFAKAYVLEIIIFLIVIFIVILAISVLNLNKQK